MGNIQCNEPVEKLEKTDNGFKVYTKDEEQIKKFGSLSVNLTNHYLSDDLFNGDGKVKLHHEFITKITPLQNMNELINIANKNTKYLKYFKFAFLLYLLSKFKQYHILFLLW